MSVNEKMTAIADKIRGLLGIEDLLTLDDMPDKIGAVDDNAWGDGYAQGFDEGNGEGYTTGQTDGFQEGLAQGLSEGQQVEYDNFWDAYQGNGNRKNYTYAFCQPYGWTDENFRPKYPFVISSANQMFAYSDLTSTVQPIDITNATSNYTYLFYNSNLVTIPKLIVGESKSLNGDFDNCKKLEDITFEGTIGRSINLQWSPLTVESAKNIISNLKNYMGTDDADTYTITLSTSTWDALDAWTQEQVDAGIYDYPYECWSGYDTAREFIQSELCWLTA